jgi:signal transduction histidine kinase
MTARALDQARETVKASFTMMMGRLRHLQPAVDDGGYQRLALSAQEQLAGIADSLEPVTTRSQGLPTALEKGAVARLLRHTGVRYKCDLHGPVSALSSSTHVTLYRMISEAIACCCASRDSSNISVYVRAGNGRDRRWVAVRVRARRPTFPGPAVDWEDLIPRLMRTTTGLGFQAIQDRAGIFDGRAKELLLSKGKCITWVMFDPVNREPGFRQAL